MGTNLTFNICRFETICKCWKNKNVTQLEITELVLVHCNIVNKKYQDDSRPFRIFVLNKHLFN